MIRRPVVVLAAAGAALALAPALPATAHGATTTPISRTAACAAGGSATGGAACRAARQANGGPFGTFDNLRLPGVDGNDRAAVPDGKLCSGGLAAFRGLDVARGDFPATTVTGGRTLTVRYRTTIPHEGRFRIYLTRQRYDPRAKLAWDDLGRTPIADVKDPPIRDGAYTMRARLPRDRTGRHILYIVWQTSSTPDTYYSCSDVVFQAPATAAPAKPAPEPSRSATERGAAESAEDTADETTDEIADETADPAADPAEPGPDLATVSNQRDAGLGPRILIGALLVAAGSGLWAMLGGRLRRRRENR
jgi:predicted carbohydrate-binding protein with CBM5 and CBM33 domain